MRTIRTMRVVPAFVIAVLVMLLTAGSGAPPGSAAGPRTVQEAPAGPTVTRAERQPAVTPPFDPRIYQACLNAPPSNPPEPAATTLGGWADVSKLAEAEAPGFPVPAAASGAPPAGGFVSGTATVDGTEYQCARAKVDLDDQGRRQFPPVRATFTAFGFEPVTATAFLIQDAAAPLTAVSYSLFGDQNSPITGVATAEVRLRLADVTVNGVPVNVGGDCRTTGPLTSPGNPIDPGMLVLAGGSGAGDPQPFYELTAGGALAGTADIPALTGCVTPSGENLDALLDAAVSGPDNYIKMEQGPVCTGTGGANSTCAGVQVPLPGPLWTITGGGAYTGTSTAAAPLTLSHLVLGNGVVITCPSSPVTGAIPDADGPPRGAQLTLGWPDIPDCAGTLFTLRGRNSAPYGTWTVTMKGTPSPALYTYAAGTAQGKLRNVTFELDGAGLPGTTAPCAMQVTGFLGLTYENSSSQLSVGAGNFNGGLTVTSSGCPTSGQGVPSVGSVLTATASYTLSRPVTITSP